MIVEGVVELGKLILYPMTVTGKMMKFVMRDQMSEELGISEAVVDS